MKSRSLTYAAIIAALCIGVVGCSEDPVPTGPTTIVNVTQVVNLGTPLPNGSPSPSPAPGGVTIESLKVSAIGGEQLNPPKTWKVGARFRLTATPHDKNGVDPCKSLTVCPYYSDKDITWYAASGVGQPGDTSAVVIDQGGGEDTLFNRDFTAQKPGTFTVRAQFRGTITSGDFIGTVVQ